MGKETEVLGPAKGDFIAPSAITDGDEPGDALPEQEEFWRPPVRFGSVPVEKEPLGWDRRRGFRKLFPHVPLPFQVVERVSFAHSKLEPNRLFWGDNLHVMRQLPSESIDLIYIDPPFFSGRQYNVIFGDQNELRSFSDMWEGGMPGYLIWLNARVYEMKRLLKKTGSLFLHCDWHASHYIKVELDKIFGYDKFVNECVWCYSQGGRSKEHFPRKHDIIFWYAKGKSWTFNGNDIRIAYELLSAKSQTSFTKTDEDGRKYKEIYGPGKKKLYRYYEDHGKSPYDWWTDIHQMTGRTAASGNEYIG
jgi:adenine specific DNA methylase Mod